MKYYIANKEEWNEWEEFNLKYGNVFQSIGFAKVLEESNSDVKILLVRENNEIVGGCLFFFPLKGIKGIFSELRVISGPLIKEEEIKEKEKILEIILDKLIDIAKKKIFISIKTPFIGYKNLFEDRNFEIKKKRKVPTYSFDVYLNKDKEELWKNLNKKNRNAVRKAKKEGVKIRDAKEGDLEEIYKLYLNRVKKNIPIPFSYFKNIKKFIKSRFLVAEYENKLIAESIFLEYKNKIYYFNNGSLEEYWKLQPNTYAVWKIIEDNAGSNKILNLYGVPSGEDKNHPNYGIYKFKSGFGGNLVEEFQYNIKIISPKRKMIFDKIKNILLLIYKIKIKKC